MPRSADNIQDGNNVAVHSKRVRRRRTLHIFQAEEAEEIEAFAGIVTGPLRYFLEAYL